MYKGHLSKDGLYCLNEFCNIYLQKKVLNLFGNDIGTFYICIRFIIVMNTTLKKKEEL